VDKATQVQVIHAGAFHDAPSRRIQQSTNGLDNVTHDILPFLDWVYVYCHGWHTAKREKDTPSAPLSVKQRPARSTSQQANRDSSRSFGQFFWNDRVYRA
jgi:hypothetical protein